MLLKNLIKKSRLEIMVILQHLYHMGRHSIGPSTDGSSSQNCGLFRFHRLTSRICPNTLGALTVSQMRILKHLKIGIELVENDQNIHSVSKLCTLMQYSLVFDGDRPCHSMYCCRVQGRPSMVLSNRHPSAFPI